MNTPARGPQPILRADGTTTTSSGTIHTLLILAADRWRPRTVKETAMAKNPSDFTNAAERARWVRDNPNAPITCRCGGGGCQTCGGDGTLPAWVVDPEITGYPHERR